AAFSAAAFSAAAFSAAAFLAAAFSAASFFISALIVAMSLFLSNNAFIFLASLSLNPETIGGDVKFFKYSSSVAALKTSSGFQRSNFFKTSCFNETFFFAAATGFLLRVLAVVFALTAVWAFAVTLAFLADLVCFFAVDLIKLFFPIKTPLNLRKIWYNKVTKGTKLYLS
ncbi:MAG: hypothetical protein LWW98_11540, partial [Deltaproteobacteria bacterium]|nr:hypothetical protein [Deltaproteobacteria bacterium]